MCYAFEKNKSRKRWNNVIMAQYIFFKIIDIIMLTFYDIFDNSDLFNSSLVITIEKFLWMIIETLIYSFEVKTKYLIIIQILCSSIIALPIVLPVFYCFFTLFLQFIFIILMYLGDNLLKLLLLP